MYPMYASFRLLLTASVVTPTFAFAQAKPVAKQAPPVTAAPLAATFDTLALAAVKWREIGPFRGGRSSAVAGSVARPKE